MLYKLSSNVSLFGAYSEKVELVGLNTWQPGDLTNMNDMFRSFALTSNYCIDLSSWSKNEGLQATHRGFNTGTFFQIKEPFYTVIIE